MNPSHFARPAPRANPAARRLRLVAPCLALLLAASLVPGAAARQDASATDIPALIREVARSERAMQPRRLEYTWTTTVTERDVNDRGEVKGQTVEVFETYPVKGEFARKLVSKNGVPVSPERAESELKRAAETIQKADREAHKQGEGKTPTAASAAAPPDPSEDIPTFGFTSGHMRRSGFSSSRFYFAPWRFLRAAAFHSPRRETLRGRETIVLDFRPRADFRPADDLEKPYAKLAGRVWIDAADKALARLEAWPDPAQPRKKEGKVAGASPDSPAVVYEEARLPDGLWIQSLLHIRTARDKDFFNGMSLDVSKEASDFKRFDADSGDEKLDAPKP